MITTPEIICDFFSFLDKDQIERIQLVNKSWNNVIIHHKNILPLRQFVSLDFNPDQIYLYASEELGSYKINFDGTNLSKIEENVSSRYLQLTVDEVLTNLNNIVFNSIQIQYYDSEDLCDYFMTMMKLVIMKTGCRFCGRFGYWEDERFGSELVEIFDNYIIVDELDLGHLYDSYIREICANPEIIQLPSTPKEIILACLEFKENEEILNFTCNGKLNGANRVTIGFETSDTNYGNFIRQWFELYHTHENPMSLVGKFELRIYSDFDIVFGALKTFLNNTQLRVKYSLETKELRYRCEFYDFTRDDHNYSSTGQYFIRRCVLHETDSYALVIEMAYEDRDQGTDMSSINASDLDQPPCDKMEMISFCVKSL